MKRVVKKYGKSELLEAAAAFHGHVGPYLVLGLKAGELANKVLGSDPFEMKAEVYCPPGPPKSCIVDGIQFSTGCTMGKGNIAMHASEGIRVVFTKGKKSLQVSLKSSIAAKISSLKGEAADEMGKEFYEDPAESLFDYEIKGV